MPGQLDERSILRSMVRAGIALVFILFSGSAAFAQQWPKEMTFPSGRKVTIVDVTQIETKDKTGRFGSALLLIYETKLKLANAAGLQKEVNEIWTWLKVDAEYRKLTEAFINVEEATNTTHRRQIQFAFKKQSDGSWREQKADIP